MLIRRLKHRKYFTAEGSEIFERLYLHLVVHFYNLCKLFASSEIFSSSNFSSDFNAWVNNRLFSSLKFHFA